jgi:hypothetical protein
VPDLDDQLSAGRQRLLDAIDQPPFEPIASRARAVRRRRGVIRAGAAVATAVLVSTAGIAALLARSPETVPRPPAADASASPGAIYKAEGITINGLPAMPVDLPGRIIDVEFLDPDRGTLLTSSDCPGGGACQYTMATTDDGGRTWKPAPMPDFATAPLLVPVGDRVAVVPTPLAAANQPATALPGTARLQLVDPDRCGGPVNAWVPQGDSGAVLVPLLSQPDLRVCWTAPVRAGDGAWWVGGVKDGAAAVAVSRDGGQTWTTTRLGDTGAGARVVVQGRTVYATVLGPADELLAVHHSDDGGKTFAEVTHKAPPSRIGGDLVPLLDGRLLVVNGDGMGGWFLSADRGATWSPARGLHATARVAQTQAGWVAYQMTTIYTAFSVDGSTWSKINAQ